MQPAVWVGAESCGGVSAAELCTALLRLYMLGRSPAACTLAVAAAAIINKVPAGVSPPSGNIMVCMSL